MARRLVLGCGSIGHAVVRELGPDDLLVVDDDESRVETLRGDGVAAELADPTDPAIVAAHAEGIDTIVVAGDDPAANRAAATAASGAAPDASLVAYTGQDPSPDDRAAIEDAADRIVEHGATVAGSLLGDIEGEDGARHRGLWRALRNVEGTLGVFSHDNPDPDAIGSAIALRDLARAAGLDAHACYFGEIAHQENRALVNLLDLTLRELDPGEYDPDAYDAIALVDHSRPGVNDQLPADLVPAIVIDHHPPREPIEAGFVDIRGDVGATSTLLADHFERSGIDVAERVATALLYGIRVDTRDFSREITGADFGAAAFLLPHADMDVLERVESPSIGGETFDTLARAIRNRNRRGDIVVSGVGPIAGRDALSQAADQLLAMDGVTTTLVHGFRDGTVYVSARTRGTDLDIGETVRQAYGRIGSAGGHTDMAGAQLPLGILADVDEAADTDALATIIDDVLTDRFFEVVGLRRVLEFPPGTPEATSTEE